MFRFSRNHRFFMPTTYDEYVQTAQRLITLVQFRRKEASAVILTCEDSNTYQYSNVTFLADEVTDALENRKSYTLEQFSLDIWRRSMDIQLTLNDATNPEPFMITLSCDKQGDARSMKLYGQNVDSDLFQAIVKEFAQPTFFYSIGDGYSKPPAFNMKVGEKLTGIRLS